MQVAETLDQMTIDPSKLKTEDNLLSVFRGYETIESFIAHCKSVKGFDAISIAKYIVLLYSEDSILNTRPPKLLEERQTIAANKAGLADKEKVISEKIRDLIFGLNDAHVFSFAFEYLVRQKKFLWQDIVVLETQMLENQRLRMRPVAEDRGKDELKAFGDKDKMLDMFKKWRIQLEEYYDEFFGDNEQMRAIHKINRDNMATIENFAI